MLTGADVLNLISWVYWGAGALALLLALVLPKTPKRKVICASVVVGLFSILPLYARLGLHERNKQIAQEREKLNVAMARFEERCKTAGEKIYKTLDDVEGVLLTNVRPDTEPSDRSDPNWPDAALPDEGRGDWYVRSFLFWEHHQDKRNMRGFLNETPSNFPGYRFVDVGSESVGYRRIRLDRSEPAKLVAEPLKSKPARFAVSFENFVDPDDRKLWIAGTKVTITDTAAKEVLAEKTWYSVEPGQGSTAGFRSPWGFAQTCPFHVGWSGGSTRYFVDQVLKPKKAE
jgi:hypothetical protein